jgi:hypothetical protein
VKDEEINNRWRDYFDGLFNERNGSTMLKLDDSNRYFMRRIQELEVKDEAKKSPWHN